MSLSTATNLVLLNSATRAGTITLPLTTTIPGRTVTLKDTTGAASINAITLTTSGSETFEDGTTTKTITTAFGYLTLAGNGGKWYITDTSQPTAMTVSTLSTQTLTANSAILKDLTASTATISSLTAGVLAASTIQAPTISSLIGLTSSLQANTVSTITVAASNIQASGLSSLVTQTSSLQANTISSQSILTSSIQANGFSSITLWASTINGFPIGAAFTGSTTYLSAAITNIQQGLISSVSANTITTVTLSTMAFYVSSINGLLPTGSGSTTYLSAGVALVSSATVANLAATQGYISSLVVDSFQIGSNAAFINMGDVIATSLSTIQLNTGILYANSNLLGNTSSLTAIQFYGNTGTYSNTALAEVSTGAGIQEFVVFRGSSTNDRIRMQTTGNIVFETGVAARLWPNAASNTTPAMVINTLSNVGIQTASPAFPLDVAGTARAQTLSSFAINVSSINGYIPVGAFNGSSVYLSSGQATLGTQVNISSIATFSTGNIALFSSPSVSSQFTITDTQLSTVSTTLSQILTKPTYQVASTTTYSYTGAYQTVTASTNWTHVFVQMWGAGGAGGLGSAGLVGGGGAYVQGYLPVVPGDSFTLIVGQGGQYNAAGVAQQTDAQGGGGGSGTNAGGGGGRTAIQRNSTDIVVVGGGGAASGTAGTGGAATWSGIAWDAGNYVRQTATYLTSNAGGGGQTIGGTSPTAAYNGGKALGGTTTIASAGGGGSGWYGGGGSASGSTGAGGGSSYADFLLAVTGYDAALSTPGFSLSPLRAATGAGQGGAGIGAAGSNGLVYITPFTAVNNYKLFAFGTTLMPSMTSVDNVGAVRIWRDSIDPNWALDVGARSRFQYLEAAAMSTLVVNTSNLTVSSINGTVYGAFAGSTMYLSSATGSFSSINVNSLTATAGVTVNKAGLTTSNAYGTGSDTLTIQTTVGGTSGGVASLFFGTPTYGYPLGRIAALDTGSTYDTSALIFQNATINANSAASGATTFQYVTTSLQSYTVPAGVTSITVKMWGAGGGGTSITTAGGAGAYLTGTLTVTPGQVLSLLVGGGGTVSTGGYGGGGGAPYSYGGAGGRSAIQTTFLGSITAASGTGTVATYTTSIAHGLIVGEPVIISGVTGFTGSFVVASVPTTTTFTVASTATGSLSGQTGSFVAELVDVGGGGGGFGGIGGNATYSGTAVAGLGTGAGGGGSQTGGGASGGTGGTAGSLFQGGGGGYAGGGGGGYYGGGGDNNSGTGAGGGGSSWSGLLTSVSGANSADRYTPPGTGVPGYITGIAQGCITGANLGGHGLIIIVVPLAYNLAESMRISNNGYLGIGTSSPTMLLDVAGTSRSQGMSTLSFNTSSINGIPFGAQALGVQTLVF